jgi:uncharacterized protein (UPF0332 family)
MAITPPDLLNFARSLLPATTEPPWRSAASRAYYFAYHSCFPLAASLGLVDDGKGGSHHQLIQTLITHPVAAATRDKDMKIRSIGYLLRNARARRVDADYDLTCSFKSEMADETIGMVLEIQTKLLSL